MQTLVRVSYCRPFHYSLTLLPSLSNFGIKRSFRTTAKSLAINMETVNTTGRLKKLRELMKENNVDVYSMVSYT